MVQAEDALGVEDALWAVCERKEGEEPLQLPRCADWWLGLMSMCDRDDELLIMARFVGGGILAVVGTVPK